LLLTQRNQTISYGATQLTISREQSFSLLSSRQSVAFRLVGISVLGNYDYEEFINRFFAVKIRLRNWTAAPLNPPKNIAQDKQKAKAQLRVT
jgi:hypothetical protein